MLKKLNKINRIFPIVSKRLRQSPARLTPRPIADTFLFIYSEQSHAGRIFTYSGLQPVKIQQIFIYASGNGPSFPGRGGRVGCSRASHGVLGGSRSVGGRGWPLPALD